MGWRMDSGRQINVGDKVHWTHVGSSTRTISMSRREGEVVAIDGQTATVRKRSGKTERVEVVRLRLMDTPSQITEFVEAVRATRWKPWCKRNQFGREGSPRAGTTRGDPEERRVRGYNSMNGGNDKEGEC